MNTMDAEVLFEQLLQTVKSSGLNFKLEQSPYSAFISLKKTFLTDKAGSVIGRGRELKAQFPHVDHSHQVKQLQENIETLASANESLQAKYEFSVNDCEKNLQNQRKAGE